MIENIGSNIYETIEEFVEDLDLMNEYEEFLISMGEDKDILNKDDITMLFLDELEEKVMFIPHANGEGLIITI